MPSDDKMPSYLLAELPIFIIVMVVFTVWQYLTIKPITKTLKPSTIRLSWKEGQERYAKAAHPIFLWFGLIACVGFVLISLFLLLQRHAPVIVGIMGILFFGLIGFLYAYMISLRNKS